MRLHSFRRSSALAALAATLAGPALFAQALITNPIFSTSDVADSAHNGFTFQNTTIQLNQFTAGGVPYQTGRVAESAFTRRNAVNANQSSVWYRGATGTGAPFLGTYSNTYADLLLGNNVSRGSDNTFANGNALAEGNIERLDFMWNGGITALSTFAVAVFERGAVNVHDGFRVALITGVDGAGDPDTQISNTPTAYSTLVAQPGGWGATNFDTPQTPPEFGYTLFRYTAGDNITTGNTPSESGTQGLSGLVFNLAAFGVAPGTTIFGYSIFGFDVTDNNNSANLVDWRNATYYPTNTTGVTGTGGIDLAAINGIAFSVVPEPSTYGLAALALAGGFHAWSRGRRRPAKGSVVTAPV